MKRLDRYLLRSTLVPMGIVFAVASFVGVSMNFRTSIGSEFAHVLTAADLGLICLYTIPPLLPFVVPCTAFFGLLAGLGTLADRGEIIAMRVAGVAPRRFLALAMALGFILAIAAVVAQQFVQPVAIRRMASLLTRDLPQRATIDTLRPGVVHELGEWRIYFERSEISKRIIYGVDIVQFDSGHAPTVFHADSARVERDSVGQSLILGPGFTVMPDRYRVSTENTVLRVPFERFSTRIVHERVAMTLPELLASDRSLSAEYAASPTLSTAISLRKLRQEIADRLSLPFAAVSLALVAAPLILLQSLRRRPSRQRLFGLGLALVSGYYIARIALQPHTLESLVRTVTLMWLPNLVVAGIGAILFWRVARRS